VEAMRRGNSELLQDEAGSISAAGFIFPAIERTKSFFKIHRKRSRRRNFSCRTDAMKLELIGVEIQQWYMQKSFPLASEFDNFCCVEIIVSLACVERFQL
jgi:hypothetical protein